ADVRGAEDSQADTLPFLLVQRLAVLRGPSCSRAARAGHAARLRHPGARPRPEGAGACSGHGAVPGSATAGVAAVRRLAGAEPSAVHDGLRPRTEVARPADRDC